MLFTGERYIGNLTSAQISYEHWHRYLFASEYILNKNVLDIACGEGYGTHLLSHYAKEITGIDISEETIEHAQKTYKTANSKYLVGNVSNIPITENHSFDVIVSYETIEHVNVEDQVSFLKEVKRLLKEDGLFIISTPDKYYYSDLPGYKNEFHIKEFYGEEFHKFLKNYFSNTKILGQQVHTGSAILTPEQDNKAGFSPFFLTHANNRFIHDKSQQHNRYLIAFCSEIEIDIRNSLLIDNSMQLLNERDASWLKEIDRINSEMAQKNNELNRMNVELNQKDEELNQKNTELNQKNEDLNQKNTELNQKDVDLNHKNTELNQKDEELNQKNTELTQKNMELNQKNKVINLKNAQLNEILSSKSWRFTKPLRFIIAIPLRILQKTKSILTTSSSIIKVNGGLWKTAKKTIRILRYEGFRKGNLQYHVTYQSRNAKNYEKTIEYKRHQENVVPHEPLSDIYQKEILKNDAKYHSSGSILFVGHDARLAGAQVLLLSLIKWFAEHTGIVVKILLLEKDGDLLDKYKNIAPVLVWKDLVYTLPDDKERRVQLSDFIGKIDLIYGNTVLTPFVYDELKFLNAPYITHVHELEKSINLYVSRSTVDKMHLFTDGYIAGSNPVGSNLVRNHCSDGNKITVINDFIEKRETNFASSKKYLREKNGLIKDGLIIFGCGSGYWRKGIDLFIETASIMKQKGHSDFHFYWIGENIWDNDQPSRKLNSWNTLEQKIDDNDLRNYITFLGVKEDFFDYFLAGDVFYLPSREDPFPLVCLEAAQACLPIICFEDAGGMPDFVEDDAGFSVPFEDVKAAADKIIFLDTNKDILHEYGVTARKKFLERHSIDIAAPQILSFCRKTGNFPPAVSVIVPNYNYEKFLTKRLNSILSQSFQDFEIIILDDASTDGSLEIIEKYLDHPNVRLFKNHSNSGNPFVQWHKGFLQAKGEILWFAEADDFCEPDFLQKLLPNFNNPSVVLAYCDSFMVDESDDVTGNYDSYLDELDPHHWKSFYQVTGVQEINFGLGVKNSIPNASAVLIRKSCVTEAIIKNTFQFKFSGDWFFYTQIIKGRSIAFLSEKLNFHRKHDKTVTSKFNKSAIKMLFHEQEIIHEFILNSFKIDSHFLDKWKIFVSGQLHSLYPDLLEDDFNTLYPYNSGKEIIKKAISKGKQYKRFVFLTTNDFSSNGGSEQLWIETAIECCKRGHDVMIVIKDWDPAPYFIKIFKDIGIQVVFKRQDEFNDVLLFRPDLLVVSIGDMDEGIEWYDHCQKHDIPYIIINQLTKEPEYWPIRTDINDQVKKGYLGAVKVFFTCNNNHMLMEKRLNCKIPNGSIHFNPFHIDRNSFVPFPPVDDGMKIAIPANLSRVHKGQHLAIELFNLKKWRDRPIKLNLYGKGYDEEVLKVMVKDYGIKNVFFHVHTNDLLTIWRDNHAIFLPSFMEGLPLVLVGAMVCARVPILTDIGAHREVVDDNINGFIAVKPTVEALDEALERAYQKSGMWEEIGQKARKKILSIIPEDPIDDLISKIILFTNKEAEINNNTKITNMTNSNPTSDIESKIHPKDEMYLFFTTHPDHKNTPLQSYFDSGAGMLQTLLELLDKIGLKIEETNSFLEFACGYGRFTRHLIKLIPPPKITGSDVFKEAVDFQKEVFGVKGFYSEFNPDDVIFPEKYDVIFVASLFSHLPSKTWRLWLKKLYESLNESGVLIFSTHGKSCMANPGEMPDDGFWYVHMSETKIHSFKDYATTYVTSEFVHKAVLEETGQFIILEVPKCLWNYQDVFVVRKTDLAPKN